MIACQVKQKGKKQIICYDLETKPKAEELSPFELATNEAVEGIYYIYSKDKLMAEMKLANSNYITNIDVSTLSPICCIDAYLIKIAFPYVGYKTLKTLRIFDLLRNT